MPSPDVWTERFVDAFLKRFVRIVRTGDATDELLLLLSRPYSELLRGTRTPEDDVLCNAASHQSIAGILTATISFPFTSISNSILVLLTAACVRMSLI